MFKELSPKDTLYLSCLTANLTKSHRLDQLMEDFTHNQDNEIYNKYMNQLTHINIKKEGGSPMVCEGILNLCGTSSQEIEERTKAIYIPQIQQLTSENLNLAEENDSLTAEIQRLQEILKMNKITY